MLEIITNNISPGYDVIAHFKGFDNLLLERSELKKKYGKDVAMTFSSQILSSLKINSHDLAGAKSISEKKILIVWDGDKMHENQWTFFMVETVKLLSDYNIDLLTCTELGGWGSESRNAYLNNITGDHGFKSLNESTKKFDLYMYTYGDKSDNPLSKLSYFDTDPKDYTVVGMYLLYLTSKLVKPGGKTIVLCIGGGQTPLDEYYYTIGNKDKISNTVQNYIPSNFPVPKPDWYVYDNPDLLQRRVYELSKFHGTKKPDGVYRIHAVINSKQKFNTEVFGFGNNNSSAGGGKRKTRKHKKYKRKRTNI